MATGGCPEEMDSRVTCSVCLEAYEGRQPKLLPCYHTFCLSCLNQLTSVDHGDAQAQGQTRATITCPTCRAIHTLPPGGANSLQTNFYIDSTSPQDMMKQTRHARSSAQQDCQPSDDLQSKVKEQLLVMQAVLTRLLEDDMEMEHQKRAIEANIQQEYEAGIRVLDKCRDQCLKSVEVVKQQLTDKLQADLLSAHSLLKPLQNLAQEGSSKSQNLNSSIASHSHPALLSDGVLRHFRQLSTRDQQPPSSFFFYEHSNDTQDLSKAACQFMGTVLPANGRGSNPQLTGNRQGKTAGESTGARFTAGGEDFWRRQQQQLEALQTLVHQVQRDGEQQKKELSMLKQKVSDDAATVKRDVTAVSASLLKDIGSLQKDLTAVQKDSSESQQSWKQADKVISKLQSQMDKINAPVFFNVLLTENVTLPEDRTLKLDKVVSNIGGGYNVATGIFTAPRSGIYLFLATARADYDYQQCMKSSMKSARFCIYADGSSVVSSWGKGPLTFTAHAIVRLTAGRPAYLRTEKFDKQSFRGEGFTSFCGVLLYSDV